MTPLEQTLLTLILMYLAYLWGRKDGILEGTYRTIVVLREENIIDDEAVKLFVETDEK